ncbi:MAG: hypothetical protein WAW41_09275 [Methylobacter sp.]
MRILFAILFLLPGLCHAMNQDELVSFIQQAELAKGFNHSEHRISIFVKAFYVTVNKLVQQGNAITLESLGRFNPRESYDGYCRNPRNPYALPFPCIRWRSVKRPPVVGHSGFLRAMQVTAPTQQYTDVEIARHVDVLIKVITQALVNGDMVESRGFGTYYIINSYDTSRCGNPSAQFPKFRPSPFFIYGTFFAAPELKAAVN